MAELNTWISTRIKLARGIDNGEMGSYMGGWAGFGRGCNAREARSKGHGLEAGNEVVDVIGHGAGIWGAFVIVVG